MRQTPAALLWGLKEYTQFNEDIRIYLIEATLVDSYIHNNSLLSFDIINKGVVGAVFVEASKVTFKGDSEISYNYGSAIYLIESASVAFEGGTTSFYYNEATHGGAIKLSSSVIHVAPFDTHLRFHFNSAIVKGGAIYAELISYDNPCVFAFLNSSNSASVQSMNSSLWFIDNKSRQLFTGSEHIHQWQFYR